jgi:4a-hydroxytetrahydrobiopterin dehydratase
MAHTKPELLDANRLAALEQSMPDWHIVDSQLERWFEFQSFKLAMEFVQQVAEIAERMDHHPDIDIRYRKVRLSLTTHSAGGLTNLDIEAAARIRVLQPHQF